MSEEFTHVTDEGTAQMVDVGAKEKSQRRAVAQGAIRLRSETVDNIREDTIEKGDVLTTARLGAIQAVKHTWERVPMCHQIPITNVDTSFELDDETVMLEVAVETVGKTGCEMEAIDGVTAGLTVVWDMVKSAEKADDGLYPETAIEDIRVIEKSVERGGIED